MGTAEAGEAAVQTQPSPPAEREEEGSGQWSVTVSFMTVHTPRL